MARTPLLHALQQIARDFGEADARDISVEEVQEQRRHMVSRRELLKGAGALAAGIALSNPLSWGGRVANALASSLPRIGIIGAGISGDSNLLGSYSCWLVGQYTTFSGYEKVRQGNIHFGGEHCSYNFQGYMEGGGARGQACRE